MSLRAKSLRSRATTFFGLKKDETKDLRHNIVESQLASKVSMNDPTSERYFIHQLNTSPTNDIVRDLLENLDGKSETWIKSFVRMSGLLSLNSFLLKGLSSNEKKDRTSVSNIEEAYETVELCIRTIKKICDRIGVSSLLESKDLFTSLALVVSSSAFQANRPNFKVLRSQNDSYDLLIQSLCVGAISNILHAISNAKNVYQEPIRFTHAITSLRQAVVYMRTEEDDDTKFLLMENIQRILSFINEIIVIEIPKTEDQIHISPLRDFIDLGIFDAIRNLDDSSMIEEEVAKLMKSPALLNEERLSFSKYDYLRQLVSQLYAKLGDTDSYSIFINVIQQLISISNSKENLNQNWVLIDKILSGSIQTDQSFVVVSPNYLQLQDRVISLQNLVKTLESKVGEGKPLMSPKTSEVPKIQPPIETVTLPSSETDVCLSPGRARPSFVPMLTLVPTSEIPNEVDDDTYTDTATLSHDTSRSHIHSDRRDSNAAQNVSYRRSLASLSLIGTGEEELKTAPSIIGNRLSDRMYRRSLVFGTTRRFYFDSLEPANTIFAGLINGEGTNTAFILNHDELATLFGGPYQSIADVQGQMTFLTPMRYQSVLIPLETVKLSFADIRTYILMLDQQTLGERNIAILKDVVPTNEERDILSTYEGNLLLLTKVDRFFYELKDIPNLKARMESWHFKITFRENIALVLPDLETIGKACAELACSQKWLDVLRIILQMGNFLNQRGGFQVDGFRMSTLAKLSETKSSDGKTNLLGYLRDFISNRYPFLSNFWEELINVDMACRMTDLSVLQNKLANIGRGFTLIDSLLAEYKHAKQNDIPIAADNDLYVDVMSSFYRDNYANYTTAAETYRKTIEQLETLAVMYGEDSLAISTKPSVFFKSIWSFVEAFKEKPNDEVEVEKVVEGAFNVDLDKSGSVTSRAITRLHESKVSTATPPSIVPVRKKPGILESLRGNITVRASTRSRNTAHLMNMFTENGSLSADRRTANPRELNEEVINTADEEPHQEDDGSNEKKILKVCKKTGLKKKQLLTPQREYRFSGVLARVAPNGSSSIDYDAYLFNDLLLLHTPKQNIESDNLVLIDLDDMTVLSLPDTRTQKHAICLQTFSGDQIHILLCYTAISKDNWLAALRDILDIKFFNSNWTKKISEDIEGHLNNTSDTAQSYYAYDLETLYADAIKDEPDAPSNIEYTNNTNEIACATLNKLLLKLAHPTEQDNTFLYTFMLTYKSFISTEDLLEFLIRRWNTPPPHDSDFQVFKREFLFPVRLRIVQILSYWVEHHFYNFRDYPMIQTQFTNFIVEEIKKTKMEAAADRLMLSTRFKNKQRDTFSHQQQQRQKAQLQILQELISKTDSKTANSTAITLMSSMQQTTTPAFDPVKLPINSGSQTVRVNGSRKRAQTKLGTLVSMFDQLEKESKKAKMTALPTSRTSTKQWKESILTKTSSSSSMFDDTADTNNSSSVPKVIRESILHFNSIDIAQQISMIDFETFSQIQPKECLNQAWNKSNQKRMAPNIYSMISRTNAMCDWAAYEVLRCENIKDRKKALIKLIDIAEELLKLNNLNALKGVIGGLNSNAIFRLKKTWEGIDSKKKDSKDEMASLVGVDKSFKLMREKVSECRKNGVACIVYMGVYLSDLTFIDDGNKDKINDKINFKKQKMLCSVIRNIQRLQKIPYQFPSHKCRESLNDLSIPLDEDQMFELSLRREARQNQ